MLGVEIDRNLTFDKYVSALCNKAEQKVSVLARLSNYISTKQRSIMLKAFIEARFGY